jgi:predicted dehydrogenase
MLVNLIGPVRRVDAMAATPFATRVVGSGPRAGDKIAVQTPTTIACGVEFENGALVTFTASWDVWRHGHNNMEIYGETGSMVVPDPNFFGGELQVSDLDGPFTAGPDEGHPFGRNNRQARRGVVADYRGAGIADLAAALAEGRPHRCDGTLSLHVIEVLEGILRSAREGMTVKIETRCVRPVILAAVEAGRLLGMPDPAKEEALCGRG